ncbi:MAG TPA: hypothetical protein PLL72_03075 [Burkholderiaceae bacterium]|nr:hypothetical protein [Burkholderiaceae bacterium]
MKEKADPQAVAAFHFFSDPDAPENIEQRLRLAVNAAIIAERHRTLAYWLCRWRQKLIWFGGWELPNCGGFEFRRHGRWADPTPVKVARCFTHFGRWWQLVGAQKPLTFAIRGV